MQALRVAAVSNGALMREAQLAEMPQVGLLDVGLPGEDGFSLARWLRERHPTLGIIMVTAATDSVDRIAGLETGGDDYATKPFDPRELPAIRLGRCSLDRQRRVLINDAGAPEPLTSTEFDLPDLFCQHPNWPLTREWPLETTSQRDYDGSDRSIDLRVTRLRRKIELDPDKPQTLRTVRGAGYMLALE